MHTGWGTGRRAGWAALAAYRKARSLYERAGLNLPQGNAWSGEADVELHLEHNDAALATYRRARTLYKQEGVRLGEGDA